jgi:hypothetical protein
MLNTQKTQLTMKKLNQLKFNELKRAQIIDSIKAFLFSRLDDNILNNAMNKIELTKVGNGIINIINDCYVDFHLKRAIFP